MKRVGAAEIRRLDQTATRDFSIPSILLMENAGRSVCEIITRDFKCCKVLVFVGKGNNGGDGLVVARHLANRGYSVQVVLLEAPSCLKPDPLLNFTIISRMGIPWSEAGSEELFSQYCSRADLVVDAIFGVGMNGVVTGIFEDAIRAINGSRRPVVSIDIPSGLDADSGQIHGVAVKATATVTLALPKTGLFEGEGPKCAGEIEIVDIGLPVELLRPFLED